MELGDTSVPVGSGDGNGGVGDPVEVASWSARHSSISSGISSSAGKHGAQVPSPGYDS